MRPGGSLGHHQSFSREERFTNWKRELFGDLVHGLGAMAAEYAFYGENSNGVGGDLGMTTAEAAWMVGTWGMGPHQIEVKEKFADESEDQTRRRIQRQFERIGVQLMQRSRGGADFHGDPIAAILGDPTKRSLTAQLMGQALVTAYNFIQANRDKVEAIAQRLVDEGEIYGDELVALLDAQDFVKPEVDFTREDAWPSEIEWRVPPEEDRPWRR
jgi:ATP-dependent Zn protease